MTERREKRGAVRPPDPSPRALRLLDDTAQAVQQWRRAHAVVLSAVHALDAEDVAGEIGYAHVARLLQDHVQLDRADAATLRRHARLLHPTPQPSGHLTPPALPATASLLATGAVGEGHVRVIATAMTRLSALAHLDPATLRVTEERLAELARERTPKALADAAAEIGHHLDPDGAAPPDDEESVDELRVVHRRNGALDGSFRFVDPAAAEIVLAALRAATPPAGADGDPAGDQPADLDRPDDVLDGRSLARRQAQGMRDLFAHGLTCPLDLSGDGGDHLGDIAADTGDDAGSAGDLARPVPPDAPSGRPFDELLPGLTDPSSGDPADELADAVLTDRILDDLIARLLREPPFDDPPDPAAASPPPPGGTDRRQRQMAIRSAGRSPTRGLEGGEPVHVAVTIDWTTLRAQLGAGRPDPRSGQEQTRLPGIGHLGSGVPIGPETARRLACDAEILPVLLGSHSEPLDIGRKTRVVPSPMRRAVITRDRHCAFPGCRRHARACQAHHVVHWIFGGPTAVENLTLLCSFHHTLIHHGGWTVTMIDGLPWFTPPWWLDRERRPRHNRPPIGTSSTRGCMLSP